MVCVPPAVLHPVRHTFAMPMQMRPPVSLHPHEASSRYKASVLIHPVSLLPLTVVCRVSSPCRHVVGIARAALRLCRGPLHGHLPRPTSLEAVDLIRPAARLLRAAGEGLPGERAEPHAGCAGRVDVQQARPPTAHRPGVYVVRVARRSRRRVRHERHAVASARGAADGHRQLRVRLRLVLRTAEARHPTRVPSAVDGAAPSVPQRPQQDEVVLSGPGGDAQRVRHIREVPSLRRVAGRTLRRRLPRLASRVPLEVGKPTAGSASTWFNR